MQNRRRQPWVGDVTKSEARRLLTIAAAQPQGLGMMEKLRNVLEAYWGQRRARISSGEADIRRVISRSISNKNFGCSVVEEAILGNPTIHAHLMIDDDFIDVARGRLCSILGAAPQTKTPDIAKEFASRCWNDPSDGSSIVNRKIDKVNVTFPSFRSWVAFSACQSLWQPLKQREARRVPAPVAGARGPDIGPSGKISEVFQLTVPRQGV